MPGVIFIFLFLFSNSRQKCMEVNVLDYLALALVVLSGLLAIVAYFGYQMHQDKTKSQGFTENQRRTMDFFISEQAVIARKKVKAK